MQPGIRHLALYDENCNEVTFPGYDRVAVRVEVRLDASVRLRGMQSEDVVFPGLALFAGKVARLGLIDPQTGEPFDAAAMMGKGAKGAPIVPPIPKEMITSVGDDLVLREPVVRF